MENSIPYKAKSWKKIDALDVEFFLQTVGIDYVLTSVSDLLKYSHDETEDFNFPAEVILKPINAVEISKILKYCNTKNIAVTPICGRTGLSGGALCLFGGCGISLERMNKIINIDQNNLQITVEPGVITHELREYAQSYGLYYSVDPSSLGSCQIGGNLAENAGGAKAFKYGTTKDYVLSLEVVLANGDITQFGVNTLKNATGYNIVQLMVGSEGTLGVITKATLKLLPFPPYDALIFVPFFDIYEAIKAVSAILQKGHSPSVLEFMERSALEIALQKSNLISFKIEENTQAYLLIEVDGFKQEIVQEEILYLGEMMQDFKIGEILFAESSSEKEALWSLRRSIGHIVKSHSIYKELDTVVPRFALSDLFLCIKNIGKKYGMRSVIYGHAGDGNLHVNILKDDLSEEYWNNEVPKGVKEIFELTIRLGGTLSGEHGVGLVLKPYLKLAFAPNLIALMRQIKEVFDPNFILNPGKIFD